MSRKYQAKERRHRQRWTDEELKYLVREWNDRHLNSLARRLRRTWVAILEKAKRIGLSAARPSGFVTLTQAAKDLGYSLKFTKKIFAWAGVEISLAPRSKAGKYAPRLVEWDDAREAAERWMRYANVVATPDQAANDLGCCPVTLRLAARFAGKHAGYHRPTLLPLAEWSEIVESDAMAKARAHRTGIVRATRERQKRWKQAGKASIRQAQLSRSRKEAA